VRQQVANRRPWRAGRVVEAHRPLLGGDEGGKRREELGDRRDRGCRVEIADSGGDGAGPNDREPDASGPPVERCRQETIGCVRWW